MRCDVSRKLPPDLEADVENLPPDPVANLPPELEADD